MKQLCFGNIVHTVLEKVINKNQPIVYEDIAKEYNKSIDSHDPSGKVSKEYISVGKVVLDEFYDQNIDSNFEVFDKEMSFNFIIGNYRIIGYIDRVDLYEDEVYITDYKTR